jgi:hypothetical protein
MYMNLPQKRGFYGAAGRRVFGCSCCYGCLDIDVLRNARAAFDNHFGTDCSVDLLA